MLKKVAAIKDTFAICYVHLLKIFVKIFLLTVICLFILLIIFEYLCGFFITLHVTLKYSQEEIKNQPY